MLPGSPLNRFGYDLEFDKNGNLDDMRIDFAAIAAHLMQLEKQARKHGARIRPARRRIQLATTAS